MIRVFIADDHTIVRRGVHDILDEASGIAFVGEAGSGKDTLRALRKLQVDILLLDIALPDCNGLDVLKQLVSESSRVRTLILSMYPERQYALRAIKAGAWGYLTKDSAPEELVIAIRHVAAGRKYITASLAEELASVIEWGMPEEEPHRKLSDREYQVLSMLGGGKSVGEIAHELNLSPKTVSTYRDRIRHKLNLRTTAEIIRYALEHGLGE